MAIKGILEIAFVPIKALFVGSWSFIKSTVITAVETIGGVLGGLAQALSGIIDFVAGVFTGDWGRAWQGVKDIFGGIFNGIKAIAKGAINGVIGIINAGISGINSIKAPDWVPGIGGKGPNIPKIPRLAKGTRNFGGGLAMVGELGPELVRLPRGAQVIPNKKTEQMINTTLTPLAGTVQYVGTVAEPILPTFEGKANFASKLKEPNVNPLQGIATYIGEIIEPIAKPLDSIATYAGIATEPAVKPLEGIAAYAGKIIEPTIKPLQGLVTYIGRLEEPDIRQGHTPDITPDRVPINRAQAMTDTFAPEINITIEGGSGSVKESIPDIKREVEKALYPALESYFQQLRSKRPSMTLA